MLFVKIVVFLAMAWSTVTPAIAQSAISKNQQIYPIIGPYKNPIAISLVENGGTLALKVQLVVSRCMSGYSVQIQLERQVDEDWVSEGPIVPVQLGNFDHTKSGKTLRTAAVFTPDLWSPGFLTGVYRTKIQMRASYSQIDCSDAGMVYEPFTHIETPYLRYGSGRTISGLPSVERVNIGALNTGRLEFRASLVNRTRLTIFQEFGTDKVVSFSEDYQPGNTLIATRLHPEFRPGLAIKVHMLDLTDGKSTVGTLYEVNPNVRFNNASRRNDESDPEWQ